jgi:CheY-like chemotaxis protein
MGGDITVKSELRHGSTFAFDIQVAVVDVKELDEKRSTRRVIALEPGQPQYRLLIVDDKPDNRKVLVKLLHPFGFEFREASNGRKAIEIWEQWEPHLIWMDLRMPVMNGYEATQRIRATAKGKETIIITLSASSFEEERPMALSKGCDDFLRKPFQEQEIFDLLYKHLGVRFVYEEEQQVAGSRQQVTGEDALTPDAFAALPIELVSALREAIDALDIDTTNRIIDQIRQQNKPLATALAELAGGYRFDTLQELFEEGEHGIL